MYFGEKTEHPLLQTVCSPPQTSKLNVCHMNYLRLKVLDITLWLVSSLNTAFWNSRYFYYTVMDKPQLLIHWISEAIMNNCKCTIQNAQFFKRVLQQTGKKVISLKKMWLHLTQPCMQLSLMAWSSQQHHRESLAMFKVQHLIWTVVHFN